MQTVQVHAGYHGLLGVVRRLLVDDAGQRANLVGRQVQLVGLGLSLAQPEVVVLLLHALQEGVDADIPIDVIGVGHEHSADGARIIAQFGEGGRVAQGIGNGRRVEHQLVRQDGSQTIHRASLGNGEVHTLLLAVLQVTEYHNGAVRRLNGVTARADVLVVTAVAHQHTQSGHTCMLAEGAYLGQYRVTGVVLVDIHILRRVSLAHRHEQIE